MSAAAKKDQLIDIEGGVIEPKAVLNSPEVERVQKQVHEVVDQMRANVGQILDRGGHLEELRSRSEALNYGSAEFSSYSRSAHRRARWKNMKVNIIIATIILILILIMLS